MRMLYLSIPQRIQLDSDEVRLGDIAQVIADDKNFADQVKKLTLFQFGSERMEVRDIVGIIELLNKKFGEIHVVNLGETEFIIERKTDKEPNKAFEILKVTIVCGIVYLGSAFSVMTFNEDGCVRELLDMLYLSVMGRPHEEGSILEIAYSAGITLGILMFYNHIFRRKKATDPTPIQVEMREFEKQMNETMIINKDREGDS